MGKNSVNKVCNSILNSDILSFPWKENLKLKVSDVYSSLFDPIFSLIFQKKVVGAKTEKARPSFKMRMKAHNPGI